MILQNNHKLHQHKMDIKSSVNYTMSSENRFQTNIHNTFLMPTSIPSFPEPKIKYKQIQDKVQIRSKRLKCKDFNDLLSCYLCKGYLINPTTITNENCFHSFCRSCIVSFIVRLADQSYCPKCGKGTKPLKFSNLKSDETLKSIVYKLIPGLHHKELKRCLSFNNDKNITKLHDLRSLEEEEFFAPGEPISLSLEYHPKALSKSIPDDQIPPVRYLQCPAAVTVRHLKRFICTKFDLNPENQRVGIEVIYEDEVLANEFSLMDVGYCYNWKRTAPMKFFYQILVSNATKELTEIENNIVNKDLDKDTEAKYNKLNEAVTKKSVKFKNIDSKSFQNKLVNYKVFGSNVETKGKLFNSNENGCLMKVSECNGFKSELKIEKEQINNITNFNKNFKNINNNTIFTNNNTNLFENKSKLFLNSNLNNSIKESECIKIFNNNNEKNNSQKEADNLKNQNNIDQNNLLTNSTVNTDFKSLRSNNDFQAQPQINSISSLKRKSPSPKSKEKINKLLTTEINPQKLFAKCDIVVSIPQNHIHRASNSSDDSFENLSLAQLKTANKKGSCSLSPRENINNQVYSETNNFENEHYDMHKKYSKSKEHKEKQSNRKEKDGHEKSNGKIHETNDNQRQDPLKVRIDKSSSKTKYTLSKKITEKSEDKKSSKERKFSIDDVHPTTNEVDLTTYAKVIGLKPIKQIHDEKKNLLTKQSPGASPASATSSCSSSGSFIFSTEVSSSSSHKKRKKAKHSKELKELKKRKLHAEIASQSQNQPDGIKLKVKLTQSHKTHKAEKKLNGINMNNVQNEIQENNVKEIETPAMTSSKSEEKVNLEKSSDVIERIESIEEKSEKLEPVTTIKCDINENITKPNEIVDESQKPAVEQNIAKPQNFVNSNKTKKLNFIPKTLATNSKPKFPTTNTLINSFNKTQHSVSNLLSQQQNTNLSQKPAQNQQKVQDTKIPISPPLPPSLFKTTTLNLPKNSQTLPILNTQKNVSMPQRQSMSQHQQMAMNQMNRTSNKNFPSRSGTAANFIVPNPPRGIVSNASKPFSIGSIASQQNRQAAQLKRSASLDSSPPTFAKQLKLEQDRLIRKSAYASKLNSQALSVVNQLQLAQQQNLILPSTTQQIINCSSPSAVVFSSMQGSKPLQDQIFYTSAMGSTYTHENLNKKPVPILLPPSSISVSKMVDTFPNSIITSPSGLTITPQDQQPPSFQFQNLHKPALEIVRIQSNIPPIDQQQFSIINNNTVKQTNKASRPPPPPIPLKIKKPNNQMQSALTSNVSVASPQNAQLMNLNHINSIKVEKPESKSTEILDLSGGKSRSPSREKSSSPETQNISQDMLQTSAANLEATITQLLNQQNFVSSSSNLMTQTNNNKPLNDKPIEHDDNVGLQNLHLLSESATSREKLAVKTNRAVPMLSKLDVGKIRANANVRQQNASIRNIPNPSALAFRGNQQPPVPMLANISKTPPKLNSNNNQTNENIPKTQALNSNVNATTTTTTTTTAAVAALSPSSNGTDSSRLIASKKNLEQLAQNLNIRAAAAADNTAKINANSMSPNNNNGTASSPISSMVTSTTTDGSKNVTTSSNNFNVTSSSSNSIVSN